MARFDLIHEADANEKTQSIYKDVKETFGIAHIPDYFKLIALQHPLFEGIWSGYKNILNNGILPLQVKEMIFLTVALNRGCVYCSSTHLAVCDMVDVPKQTLEMMKTDINEVNPERVRNILNFAVKTIEDPDSVTEKDYAKFYDDGVSQEEVIEIFAMVFLSNTAVNMALSMGMKNIEIEISDYLKAENLKTGLEVG